MWIKHSVRSTEKPERTQSEGQDWIKDDDGFTVNIKVPSEIKSNLVLSFWTSRPRRCNGCKILLTSAGPATVVQLTWSGLQKKSIIISLKWGRMYVKLYGLFTRPVSAGTLVNVDVSLLLSSRPEDSRFVVRRWGAWWLIVVINYQFNKSSTLRWAVRKWTIRMWCCTAASIQFVFFHYYRSY